jgi:hypothetical protein
MSIKPATKNEINDLLLKNMYAILDNSKDDYGVPAHKTGFSIEEMDEKYLKLVVKTGLTGSSIVCELLIENGYSAVTYESEYGFSFIQIKK